MAMAGKKTLLLGLVVAVIVAAAASATSAAPAEPTITISNPARMIVNVLVGDKNVKVATEVTTVNLDDPEQDIRIQSVEGQVMEIHVRDGDVLVVYPDPKDSHKILVQMITDARVAAASSSTSAAPAEPTLTISNPARMIVNVLVGDKNVKVATEVATVNLDDPEQDIRIQSAEGLVTEIHVRDGDVLVVYPDPKDSHKISVYVITNAPLKPSATPPTAGP